MKDDFKTDGKCECPFCGWLKTEEELKKHLEARKQVEALSGIWYKWSGLGRIPYQMSMFKLNCRGCDGELYEVRLFGSTRDPSAKPYTRWDVSVEDAANIMDIAEEKYLYVEPATEDEVLGMLKSCQDTIRDNQIAFIKDTFKEKDKSGSE